MTDNQERELDEILNESDDIKSEEEKQFEDRDLNKKSKNTTELDVLKDQLARVSSDFQNYKMRVERDRIDTIFYLKNDIFKKLLPTIDNLDRIIKNTPADQRETHIYEGIISVEKTFKKELESLGVVPFDSIGQEVDPDKHEVMTQIPTDDETKSGLIVEEFEKGYMLGDRVLRVAKVVV